MKFELHAHTMENDVCVNMPADEIVKAYKNIGYDGIVITNHYFYWMFEWYKDEIEGLDHKGLIDLYLRGYRKAKKAGDEIGMTVLMGLELRFDGTINDYLVYGLDEDFLYNAPVLNRMKLNSFLKIMPQNALIYQAHPFRDEMEITAPCKLHGIEVYNGGTDKRRNDIADLWADIHGLKKISGSDFHRIEHLGRGGVIFEKRPSTSEDLVKLLKEEQYSLIRS